MVGSSYTGYYFSIYRINIIFVVFLFLKKNDNGNIYVKHNKYRIFKECVDD